MNDCKRIGICLSEMRKKRGLSQRSLEKLTGINHSNILKIEKGETSTGIETLSKICEALNASIEIVEKATD